MQKDAVHVRISGVSALVSSALNDGTGTDYLITRSPITFKKLLDKESHQPGGSSAFPETSGCCKQDCRVPSP